MTPGARLALGVGIIVGVTTYMAYVGASAGWQYYVTADECVMRLSELSGNRVRVSGQVAAGTLQTTPQRTRVEFILQGMHQRLLVTGRGRFPDNLEEGVEVVVEGTLDPAGVLRADKILTKCASKYEERRAERDDNAGVGNGGGTAQAVHSRAEPGGDVKETP